MTLSTWGLLGPDFLPSTRRTRTLGLGSVVRHFNDLAVPGIGGVWFGKQLLLATLGVHIAEQARSRDVKVQNIDVANAIEALGCWLAFNNNGWSSDPRLLGSTKLPRQSTAFTFARARQRNFYVTQPMRMATVQALPALGLVTTESTRFNTFRTSDRGKMFIEEACKTFRPYRRSVVEHLTMWVCGGDASITSEELRKALSPLEPLTPRAPSLLREHLNSGGAERPEDTTRRRNALDWVETMRTSPSSATGWDVKPSQIDESHWLDIKAGAKFFRAREAAIQVLDALEAHMGNQTHGASYLLKEQIPPSVHLALDALKEAAEDYLNIEHADKEANAFCRECSSPDPSQILRSLVQRDGQVLRLIENEIKPGPAFVGSQTAVVDSNNEAHDAPAAATIPLPDGVSYRLQNLYWLNCDLNGQLELLLRPSAN